jgi:hypothetical protein
MKLYAKAFFGTMTVALALAHAGLARAETCLTAPFAGGGPTPFAWDESADPSTGDINVHAVGVEYSDTNKEAHLVGTIPGIRPGVATVKVRVNFDLVTGALTDGADAKVIAGDYFFGGYAEASGFFHATLNRPTPPGATTGMASAFVQHNFQTASAFEVGIESFVDGQVFPSALPNFDGSFSDTFSFTVGTGTPFGVGRLNHEYGWTFDFAVHAHAIDAFGPTSAGAWVFAKVNSMCVDQFDVFGNPIPGT